GAADVEPARPEADQAGDGKGLGGSLGLDPDVVADLDVLLARGLAVDHDLSGAGPVPVDQAQRVEPGLRRVDREPEMGRAAEADHLADIANLIGDDGKVGDVGDAADGGPDLRQRLDLPQEG